MIRYLSRAELGERTGLTINTINSYARKRLLPEPDAMIGDREGWTEATIDEWVANRPGSGGPRLDCPYWTTVDGRRVTCRRPRDHAGLHAHNGHAWKSAQSPPSGTHWYGRP
ncbi:helix-turn-helix transcriptional regulator [Gordonia sp. MP11Mi]